MDSRQFVYFPSVDTLRGFAALSVVVYHVISLWNWQAFPNDGPLAWFRIGWLGVDLFFVISGFVIGLSAFAEIDHSGPRGFRAPFWRRRVARIVPLHYLTCLVFVALLSPRPLTSEIWPNLLAHALFIHNLFPAWLSAINGPNWSLGAEMQFYDLVLLIAPWARVSRWWIAPLTLIGVSWCWRFGAFHFHAPVDPNEPFSLWMLTTQLPGTLDEFAAGLLLARFVRSERGACFLAAMERHRTLVLGAAILAGIMFSLCLALYHASSSFWISAATVTFIRTPLAAAGALLVLISCSLNGVTWLRFSTPFRYLGTISYGIYLWQWSVLLLLLRAGKTSAETGLLLTVGITVSIAAVSWHFFEKPLLKHFGRKKRRDVLPVT